MRYLLRKSTESPQSKEMAPSNLPISSYLVEIHALMKKQKSTLKKKNVKFCLLRFSILIAIWIFCILRAYFQKKIDRKGNMYLCISSYHSSQKKPHVPYQSL